MEIPGAAVQYWLAGTALVCVVLCSLTSLLRFSRKNSPASPPLPPGRSFGLFRITESLNLFRALHSGNLGGFVRARTAKFGSKTFRTSIFFHPTVVLQGVAANRFIALGENKKQLFNSWPWQVFDILGEHVPIALHGAAHRRLRQIIVSCVGPLALQKLVGRAERVTRLHFESCWHVQNQVSLVSLINQHAFSLACNLLAGVEDQALVALLHHHFLIWIAGVTALPINLPGTTLRKAKNARKALVRELNKLMDRKQEENAYSEQAKAGDEEDTLDMLLRASDENGGFLNREELQDVMLFLLFAGHDTAAATLAFVLKFLEHSPACYDRLCQEQGAIASKKTPTETLNWADIQSMKYTWAVIQETLRLRPIAQAGFKEVREDVVYDGYKIPKGWKVAFFMISTHDDETLFHKASEFDPSRLDPPPPYAYVPFGIGHHSCPGADFTRMSISIYLHHLVLGQFKWQSCNCHEKTEYLPILRLAENYVANIYLAN